MYAKRQDEALPLNKILKMRFLSILHRERGERERERKKLSSHIFFSQPCEEAIYELIM
jgi:hypothetical protein